MKTVETEYEPCFFIKVALTFVAIVPGNLCMDTCKCFIVVFLMLTDVFFERQALNESS